MNMKRVVTFLLLAFVAGSLIAVVVKQRGKSEPERRQAATSDGSTQQSAAGSRIPDAVRDELPEQTGVIAYYFHADFRCPTCKRIESLAHKIITSDFVPELKTKQIIWEVRNYEDPANVDLAETYEVVAPTVVLVSYSKGTVTAWKNLMEVWDLVDDELAFSEMLRKEVRTALAEAGLGEATPSAPAEDGELDQQAQTRNSKPAPESKGGAALK